MPYKDKVKIAAMNKLYREKNWAKIAARRKAHHQRYPWRCAERVARSSCKNQPPRDIIKCRRVYKEVRLLNEAAGCQKWNVDHIIPKSENGPHHEHNLQILTAKDNNLKGDFWRDNIL